MAKKSQNNTSKHDAELLELGKKIHEFFETGYVSKKQALGLSFLKGAATGAGAFIGGTLVVSLLLWMLSLFDSLPFLGEIIDKARATLEPK